METLVFTLNPDKECTKNIEKRKFIISSLIGDQTFLYDPPHVTLFIGQFNETVRIREYIGAFANSLTKMPFKIIRWTTFKDDTLTNKHTITCTFDKETIKRLRSTQTNLVEYLTKFDRKTFNKYLTKYALFNDNEQYNIDTYGYPYINHEWTPHLTLASIHSELIGRVWRSLKQNCPKGKHNFTTMNMYSLDELGNMLFVEEFILKKDGKKKVK